MCVNTNRKTTGLRLGYGLFVSLMINLLAVVLAITLQYFDPNVDSSLEKPV